MKTGQLRQNSVDRYTSYSKVKTILKAKQHSKCRLEHPRYKKIDPYYRLTRQCSGSGQASAITCILNSASVIQSSALEVLAVRHLLLSSPLFELLRKGIWPDHTPIARKLCGCLGDLWCTATFIEKTGVSIWRTRRRFPGTMLWFYWSLWVSFEYICNESCSSIRLSSVATTLINIGHYCKLFLQICSYLLC